MRTITISWRRWLVAPVVIALSLVLTAGACSGSAAVPPRDISNVATITALSCSDARAIGDEVARLASASAPGERADLRKWGLDPDNAGQLESTRTALLERVKQADCTDKPTPSATATTTAPTTATSPAPTGLADFVISMPRRDGNRLNADGVDPAIRGNAEAFRKQIAEQAKHDPLTLYHYWMASPYGKADPLENETVLAKDGRVENGNVYSPKGEEVYRKWSALWNDPVLTQISAVSEIKHQGFNTGVTPEQKPGSSPGVSGTDKSGYDVDYRGGDGASVGAHSALDRCTQPTYGDKTPDVPVGQTDNDLYSKVVASHPARQGNGPADPWTPAAPVTEGAKPPGGGMPPPTYAPPPPPPPATSAPGSTVAPPPPSSAPPPVVVDPEPSHTSAPPPPKGW